MMIKHDSWHESKTSFDFLRPYFHECSYCEVHYDVIGHMEEFDKDFQYIVRKKNLTRLLERVQEKGNGTKDRRFISQWEKIATHFSVLKKSVRLRLYELYKIDFEMFGYEASEFLI